MMANRYSVLPCIILDVALVPDAIPLSRSNHERIDIVQQR
jgi:hypothetical protein